MMLMVVAAAAADRVVQINPVLLARLSGFVVPVLVALVTKKLASSAVKSMTLTALSVIAGGLSAAIATHGAVHLTNWLDGMFWSFVTASASYYGLWKPTGAAAAVSNIAPAAGIGTPVPVPPVVELVPPEPVAASRAGDG